MVTLPFQSEPDTALTSGVSDTEPENDESIVLVTTVDILMHDGGETRLGHNDQVPSARTFLLTCFSRSIEIFNQARVLLHSEEVSSKCKESVNERKRSEIRLGEGRDGKEE